MRFNEITALAAAIFHCLLTIFVVSRNLRSNINRVYLVWGGALTLWNLSTFFKVYLDTEPEAIFWLRLLHVGLIFMPVSIFHICLLVARIEKPRLIRFLYLLHFIFAVTVFTPLYVAGQRYTGFGYVVQGGLAFKLFFVLNTIITVGSIFMLYHRQQTLPTLHRARIRSLQSGIIVLALMGTHDYLTVCGIKEYPLIGIPIVPLGNLAAIFFGLVVSYSVLQHQLLNIHITLSRIAAQLVRMAFMLMTCFVILLIVQRIFASRFSGFAFFCSLGVFILSAMAASFFFPRLFGHGDEKLERRILGDSFEYHDKIRGFIQNIGSYGDSENLFHDLHDLLVNTIRVTRYQIILKDDIHHNFSLFRAHPENSAGPMEISIDSPIFHYFRSSQLSYLPFKIAYSTPGETRDEKLARQQFTFLDPEFCFLFQSGEDPFGLFLIGEKSTNEPYTSQDLQLLSSLVKSLSLVINQIRLKNQLMLAEEMELLGKMSRGIAHDINNLLTPVFTYLQLAKEGVQGPEMTQELLPTAVRNVEAMRAYVRESLFFSKTQTLQIKVFFLDKAVRTAVELVRARAKKKNISTLVHAPADVQVEMDEVLIQRLIGNLLSNAIDASPEGSQTHVHLLPMGRTETHRDWFRLLVVDHGEGISTDNLKRVTKGYFTTKDRGDTTRGFGLGLAICRKIVHMHGGQLTIHSQEGKGTTVQVDLPSRVIVSQPEAAPALSS